jgi:glycosyltransferase involved in cell wall biosynthesis
VRSPAADRPLSVLHLVLVLRATNTQYNEHSLPVANERDITLCTYFTPQLTPPPEITLFAGDGSLRGFFRALRSALDSREYAAIHAHSTQAGLFLLMGLFAWRRYRRLQPISVYTVHGSFHGQRFRNKIMMLPSLALFRRVVFCSYSAFDSFPVPVRALVGRRGRVIQNGVDIARIDRVLRGRTKPESAPFTVLSVGRLEPGKGHLVTLAAFAKGGGGGRLMFVGDGSQRASLAAAIDVAGLAPRVVLTGLIDRDEVFRRCIESDVFVSSSEHEGLPIGVLEAMACGLPVVLSDIPAHRELARGADFIPFVAPGDVGGFAREIERMRLASPETRADLGRRCRDLVRTHFSLHRMLAGYEVVYRELSDPVGRARAS